MNMREYQANDREYRRNNQKTLENTEGTIKKGQSRETANIQNVGYIRRRQTKQKHNTMCVGHHYMQANTNNVNKTCALLQTTED